MWAVTDSNRRRLLPSDLQSDPVGHLGNCPIREIADCRLLIFNTNHEIKSTIDTQRSAFMEPTMGIEPITYHLQGGCSAIELRRHGFKGSRPKAHSIIPDPHNRGKAWRGTNAKRAKRNADGYLILIRQTTWRTE